ncbi:MAG TPA: prepilin-type N-terminal cleavage/methylation domain-containing protein [Kiritimatiellia bacterium]|nr:prepilin-type N-terminal cleavage/methylation domain-containing protein [Kiritimatiellia bacterium]
MKNRSGQKGFTIIELLTGMTLLVIMVLFLTRIFTDASSMWRLGNKRVESSFDGRAAIDFMSREIGSTIADDVLSFRMFSDVTNLHNGVSADFIAFITADHNPLTAAGHANRHRQVKQVIYWVDLMRRIDETGAVIPNRYRIRRSEVLSQDALSFICYRNKQWWDRSSNSGAWLSADIIAENVRTLEFLVYDQNGVSQFNYNSEIHGPPAWVDIVVELLGEEDAIRIAQMPAGPVATEMADRAARRYFQRVYLSNNPGYVFAK